MVSRDGKIHSSVSSLLLTFTRSGRLAEITIIIIIHSLLVPHCFSWWAFTEDSLGDTKPLHVSRILLSILTDLNNAKVRIVSILSPISNFSSPLFKSLGNVQSATTTIVLPSLSHSTAFFSSLVRSKTFSIFPFSLISTQWFTGTAKSTWRQVLFFSSLILGLVF